MDIKQAVLSELETLPEIRQPDVLAFIRFLKISLSDIEDMERRFDAAVSQARTIGTRRGVTEQEIADEIQAVRSIIEAGDFRTGEGRVEQFDHKPYYFAQIARSANLARTFRVAIDTGNGVAGLFSPPLLRELGCDLVELHCDLDSSYPNHLPDPQMPENVVDLQEKVRETGVDIGLAFDGDGDRLGVIDERGERHEADYILMLLARDLLAEQPGAQVIMDIKTSQPVIDDITEHGGNPIVWKTGHSNIKIKMREQETPLAGEASGHIFYGENFYSDDALFAACKLLSFLAKSDKPLSAHLADIPRWYTSPELRVPCADDRKWDVVDAVAATLRERYPAVEIDGIRATFPDGWALVRASNTGPNLDRKSTRLNSSHTDISRMPSSA